MNKYNFLLIEDKKGRQEYKDLVQNNISLLNETITDLSYDEIIKYKELITSGDYEFVFNYSHIILHESLFSESPTILSDFRVFIEKTDLVLILFSGGITAFDYNVINKNIIKMKPNILYKNLLNYILCPTIQNLFGDDYDENLI